MTSIRVADKFITIEGAGMGRTTIAAGEYPPSSTRPTRRVFEITAKPGGLTRLTGLTIDGGTGARDAYNKGMIALGGASTTWRIDHLSKVRCPGNADAQLPGVSNPANRRCRRASSMKAKMFAGGTSLWTAWAGAKM